MGRRKSAAKPKPKRKNQTVARVFKCLFCSQEGAVSCTMNFNAMLGELKCRVCDEKFETTITALSDPIDVFSEWLDETADLQIKANKQLRTGSHPNDDVEDNDDDRVNDDPDGDADDLLNVFDED